MKKKKTIRLPSGLNKPPGQRIYNIGVGFLFGFFMFLDRIRPCQITKKTETRKHHREEVFNFSRVSIQIALLLYIIYAIERTAPTVVQQLFTYHKLLMKISNFTDEKMDLYARVWCGTFGLSGSYFPDSHFFLVISRDFIQRPRKVTRSVGKKWCDDQLEIRQFFDSTN